MPEGNMAIFIYLFIYIFCNIAFLGFGSLLTNFLDNYHFLRAQRFYFLYVYQLSFSQKNKTKNL